MLDFYNEYKAHKYSQNGEAGIIDEIINRIGLQGGVAIEFGAPTKDYCSNIFHLNHKWMKVYYDIDPSDKTIIQKTITPENINEIGNCTILSVDIDGNDYNVWKAYNGTPDIVVIEINSSKDPKASLPVSDMQHGTAYRPMVELGISKGYFLVCHTGNLIFVKNQYRTLFKEIKGDGLVNYQLYFKTEWI